MKFPFCHRKVCNMRVQCCHYLVMSTCVYEPWTRYVWLPYIENIVESRGRQRKRMGKTFWRGYLTTCIESGAHIRRRRHRRLPSPHSQCQNTLPKLFVYASQFLFTHSLSLLAYTISFLFTLHIVHTCRIAVPVNSTKHSYACTRLTFSFNTFSVLPSIKIYVCSHKVIHFDHLLSLFRSLPCSPLPFFCLLMATVDASIWRHKI